MVPEAVPVDSTVSRNSYYYCIGCRKNIALYLMRLHQIHVLCRVLLERSLARQLPDELRLQYRYSTGGTVPVRIDLDQIDKFSSDTVSLRTIQYGGPRSM